MFSKIIDFLFRNKNYLKLKKIKHIIDNINHLENRFSSLTDHQLKKKLKFLNML
ncbi:hypothetical protein RJT54_00715 [Buchnera aphidicola (Takecallis taiwana)]|uniref:hypothetical protein n=1 Tax=Buchnera aphidicola TaxID=9 RepID=UPI0031B6989F